MILTPAGNYYTKLGQECVAAGCGVDLFLFPNSYVDIATIAEVPRLTGGQIYKYTYFQVCFETLALCTTNVFNCVVSSSRQNDNFTASNINSFK